MMELRVGEVSLVEWDASCGGSDLPNQVGQVIELVEKTKSMRRKCGMEIRVRESLLKARKLGWGSR